MTEDLTIVTTCMGRLDFLKYSLENWVKNTSFRIVVVDYSCPQGTAGWIENSPFSLRTTVVRANAHEFQGRPIFHLSRARNIGAQQVDNGYILFLDAETLISDSFQPWMMQNREKETMCVPVPDRGPSDIWGTLLVHSEIFWRLNGYDEGFVGWGSEDVDMRLRLHIMGIKCCRIPLEFLSAASHSDDLRAENFIETDFVKSRDINQKYLNEKLIRMTGRPFIYWWMDGRVRKIMFDQERIFTRRNRPLLDISDSN